MNTNRIDSKSPLSMRCISAPCSSSTTSTRDADLPQLVAQDRGAALERRVAAVGQHA